VSKSISYLTSRHSTLKFIAPFVRTPSNIIRYAAENSVLSPVTKKWRDDYMAGGVKRDMALARWSLGTMAYLTAMNMYETGIITGSGPTDPASRRLMTQNLKWQPYSIRVDDTYYAFNRMDPMGFTMSMVAGSLDRTKFARSDEEGTMLMMETVLSLGDSFMDKTFFTGFAELFALFSEPDSTKATVQFGSNIVSRFIPSWLNAVGRADDTGDDGRGIVRDARRFSKSYEGIWANFSKNMDARTPWARDDLPSQRDWKGDVVTMSGGGYFDETFFIRRSDAENDPTTKALLDNWVAPSVPSQIQSFILPEALAIKFGTTELPIDLLDLDENGGEVFETFQTYVGKARYSIISEFVASDKYANIPEEQKGNNSLAALVLSSLLETGLQAGKIQFFADYNKLAKQKGWREFNDADVLLLLEQKFGKQNKPFPTPDEPSDVPEF